MPHVEPDPSGASEDPDRFTPIDEIRRTRAEHESYVKPLLATRAMDFEIRQVRRSHQDWILREIEAEAVPAGGITKKRYGEIFVRMMKGNIPVD